MKPSFTDEVECMNALKAGSRQAFSQIFSLYYERLCNYTINFTLDSGRAEDIVQEVFITLWKKRAQIVITTSLKSYLYKACHYKYIDHYRKTKRINEELEKYRYNKLMELAETDHEDLLKKTEALNKKIEELPPKCRQIFTLSKLQGLKYQEIADHLGISKNTVENQIGIAYSFLRKHLADVPTILVLIGLQYAL